jgi:alkylation response protein AidB-like acyl-CoA dehydrogenase
VTGVIDAFSDEQLEFAELAAKAFTSFAGQAAPPTDSELAAMRVELARLGLPLLAVPEGFGGGGMAEPDVVLIIEKAGFADLPVPIAETVGVVAPMVARYGSAEQREQWLPAIASGDSLGATVCPYCGLGTRRGAAFALERQDNRVHLVELDADGATTSGRTLLGEGEAPVVELDARAVWVTAALLNGVASRLLTLTVEYARTREQFGVPIGSFQAVKHMLADMAAAIESARPMAWGVARALASGEDNMGVLAGAAKALACQAGALANDHALQIHGGIGFTQEHPLHRWLVYGHELESRWGTAADHQARLGRFAMECGSLLGTFIP